MPDRQPEMCRWMDLRRRHKTPMLTEMTQTHQARENLIGKFMKSESETRREGTNKHSVTALELMLTCCHQYGAHEDVPELQCILPKYDDTFTDQ